MTIGENVEKALQEAVKNLELGSDPKFAELQQFYNEMRAKGIAVKQPYSLPMVDTIGRSVYLQHNAANSTPDNFRSL
jgi:hypothetical protein